MKSFIINNFSTSKGVSPVSPPPPVKVRQDKLILSRDLRFLNPFKIPPYTLSKCVSQMGLQL